MTPAPAVPLEVAEYLHGFVFRERSIAWLVRGNRRVPYRGVAKNNDWLHHRVAALNLRRLLALGLTQRDGAWQLA
jgi:hypothetical protein